MVAVGDERLRLAIARLLQCGCLEKELRDDAEDDGPCPLLFTKEAREDTTVLIGVAILEAVIVSFGMLNQKWVVCNGQVVVCRVSLLHQSCSSNRLVFWKTVEEHLRGLESSQSEQIELTCQSGHRLLFVGLRRFGLANAQSTFFSQCTCE